MIKGNTQDKILKKIFFWDTYKSDSDEDIQLANFSSFKFFYIALSNNKEVPNKEDKIASDMKKENKKFKRKARNLKKHIKKPQKQVHLQAQ